MSEQTLDAWLSGRTPGIPPAFLSRLLGDGEGNSSWLGLAHRGERELKQALRAPTENRENAFHLLAADAFLTYACEALARADDVQAGLNSLLERLGADFR
jgi:hypothetical protein